MGGAAFDEPVALGIHLGLDLLAHRAPQKIGFAERVSSKQLGRLHHLLLIDEDAVGLGEYALKQRVRIFQSGAAVLSVAEHADVVHRAGAVECHERDNVAEAHWPHPGQRPAHAFRFQLEHANRIAALKQLINGRIVPRERAEIDFDALLGKQPLTLLEDR